MLFGILRLSFAIHSCDFGKNNLSVKKWNFILSISISVPKCVFFFWVDKEIKKYTEPGHRCGFLHSHLSFFSNLWIPNFQVPGFPDFRNLAWDGLRPACTNFPLVGQRPVHARSTIAWHVWAVHERKLLVTYNAISRSDESTGDAKASIVDIFICTHHGHPCRMN